MAHTKPMSPLPERGPWTRGPLTIAVSTGGYDRRGRTNRELVPSPLSPHFEWRGVRTALTPYQAHIMALLMIAAPGETVSYDDLEWHATGETASSGIKVLVARLRQLLPPAVRIVADRGRGLQLLINEEEDDMTTIKTKMADQAAALPDDVVAGVMVVLGKDGRLAVLSPGVNEVTCTKMLAQGIASIATARAKSMVAKVQATATEEASAAPEPAEAA